MIKTIKKIVEQYPNRVAYKVGEEKITYNELWSSAYYYAELLKRQDESPVIIYGNKELYVIISILACIIAKRTYVPVGIYTPFLRIKKIINITKSTLIITDRKLCIEDIECCELKQLERYKDLPIKECNSDIVYIIFTSGSTGEPKGVPISETNLKNFIDWISSIKPLNEYKNAVVLNQASFSFDLSVADLYYSICNGHTLIAYDSDLQENYDKFFEMFSSEKINITVMTPTFMKLCLINSEFNVNNFPDFRCVYFCGELLENRTVKDLFRKFPDLKIINAYGPTEATSAISGVIITKEIAEEEDILPVGDMLHLATKVEIIDDEIVLKGDSVFGGYLGNYSGGYYRENNINCYKTGDVGYIDNGKLYCKGRKDSQIKYKGYRIELSDIEFNINQIPKVKESVVVAKYKENKIVKTIKAFVMADCDIDTDYIRNELAKKIPAYMIPKTIKIMDRFPVNQNGKTDRKAMTEL